jgi:hypothetical protein
LTYGVSFINNNGDLFVYGEAIGGFLPRVNFLLAEVGGPKRCYNALSPFSTIQTHHLATGKSHLRFPRHASGN